MQIKITIDDQLYQQAAALTGLTDKQALLETALHLLIKTKQKQQANNIVDLLAMPAAETVDFDPPYITGTLYQTVDLS